MYYHLNVTPFFPILCVFANDRFAYIKNRLFNKCIKEIKHKACSFNQSLSALRNRKIQKKFVCMKYKLYETKWGKEGSFLTNSPVMASTLNSHRSIGADFKCMVSITQACVRYFSRLTIRRTIVTQLHWCECS